MLYTPAHYDYGRFWLQLGARRAVVFEVKACSDVHVIIAQQQTVSRREAPGGDTGVAPEPVWRMPLAEALGAGQAGYNSL